MGAILRLQVYDHILKRGVLVAKGGTYAYEANKLIGVMAECNALGYSDARLRVLVEGIVDWRSVMTLAGYIIWDGVPFTVPDRSVIVHFELYGNGVKVDATTLTITVPPPADIATALTIAASPTPPVAPEEPVVFSGDLTRVDTGAGIGGQTIRLEQPLGTVIATTTTFSSGFYLMPPVITPKTPGIHTYRTRFAGSSGLSASQSKTLGIGLVYPAHYQ